MNFYQDHVPTPFVTVGNTGSHQPQLQQSIKSHLLQEQYTTELKNRLRACEVCKEGTYAERSIHDDWDGKLTCDKCNHRIDNRPNKIKAMKFTPENIRHLEPNQIFTYGANEKGIHGAGAAKLALRWGAKMGEYGLNGQTYGIPTKDKKIQTLPLDKIQVHVDTFLATAFSHPEYEFLVTAVGTGLAGYRAEDIAPLFKMVKTGVFDNVILPKEFHDFL